MQVQHNNMEACSIKRRVLPEIMSLMISKNVIGIYARPRGGLFAGGGGIFAGGGGIFAGGPFAAGLIAGGPFASGLNAAHQ